MFKSVHLYTDQLGELKNFYQNQLQMPITESTETFFTLQIGISTLTFTQSEASSTYHFAFNIPGNHIPSAKRWLSERVPLNIEEDKDEVYYKNFNADAIYFNDPAGNVVEFIGRRTVLHAGDFTVNSLIDISEMSITTPYVIEVGEQINQIGVPSRNDEPLLGDSLNFLGMDNTYIVLVPPNRRWYFSEIMSKTCPLEITFTGNRNIILTKDGRLEI